jgi:hypothetical protein
MSKHAQVSSAILIEVRIEVCGIHILPVNQRKPSCLVMAAIRKRARSIAS